MNPKPGDFESISGEKYALNVLHERAPARKRARHDTRWFLDRDLESWIEIRIEFPFWQNSRLSINCVKRNGNGSEVISRSNKGRIWVTEEYNQANRCLSIRQCRNRLARNKLCLANQNPYTQSDKRNFLFVFVHVFWDNYFWEYFETWLKQHFDGIEVAILSSLTEMPSTDIFRTT